MKINCEIACFNLEAALIAAASGADRIELCLNKEVGGTTPEVSMLREVKSTVQIPVYVMIRPRGGNFEYTSIEFEEMKKSLIALKNAGADGFVFGILDANEEIEINRNKELVNLAAPLPCTFHRAIDRTSDLLKSVEVLIDCGFKTVLSSGGKSSAQEGISGLKEMFELAKGRMEIMPGGGVRSSNLPELLSELNCHWVHSSGIIGQGDIPDAGEIKSIKKILE